MERTEINFKINGSAVTRIVPSSMLLIDMIRYDLKLKGTKPGCYEGECGACTVLVDGKAVNSCMFLAINAEGKEIWTIEGISTVGDKLDPIQTALIDYGAVQCGFCTSGMVITIKSFYDECAEKNVTPSRKEISNAISGNLCRCTGYVKIIDAVESLF